jgi:hypothetical protein
MNILLQKSNLIKQIELINDADLLKSIQNLLDFGLKHQITNKDFIVDDATQKMVMQRMENYYKNPDDVIDFDTVINNMRKSI